MKQALWDGVADAIVCGNVCHPVGDKEKNCKQYIHKILF